MPTRRATALLLLLTVLTGCAREGGREADPGSVPSRTTAAPSPSADPTDSAWVQLMIPMDEQAVALLDMAAEKPAAPGSGPGPHVFGPNRSPNWPNCEGCGRGWGCRTPIRTRGTTCPAW